MPISRFTSITMRLKEEPHNHPSHEDRNTHETTRLWRFEWQPNSLFLSSTSFSLSLTTNQLPLTPPPYPACCGHVGSWKAVAPPASDSSIRTASAPSHPFQQKYAFHELCQAYASRSTSGASASEKATTTWSIGRPTISDIFDMHTATGRITKADSTWCDHFKKKSAAHSYS